MDKAGIFCTSNTDISFQKVHHAFFTGNHVAHCFRFIREKAFIRTFQLHLTCHITFEFDAGTEFHRGHLINRKTLCDTFSNRFVSILQLLTQNKMRFFVIFRSGLTFFQMIFKCSSNHSECLSLCKS